MDLGRLYQLLGFFSVSATVWYCWKQCIGVRFRRVIPLAGIVTFVFICIHYKNISNPLATYLAIGLIGIPAIFYGLLYSYDLLLIVAAIYIPHNAILPADFGGIQQALNGTNIVLVTLVLGMFIGGGKRQNPSTLKNSTNVLLLIAIMIIFVAFVRGSLYFGEVYYRNMIFDFKRFITPLILFIIFSYMVRERQVIKIIVSVLMIVVIMAIFLGLLEWVNLGFGTYATFGRRLGGLNMQPNSFGAFISYYICLTLAQFIVNFRKIEAKLLIFPFLLGVRILIPTNSRGAWIAFPPAFFTVLFSRSKLLCLGAILLLSISILVNPGLVPETIRYRFEGAFKFKPSEELYHEEMSTAVLGLMTESKSISMVTRARLLEVGLAVWRQNIFFGHGYGLFQYLILEYSGGTVAGSAHNFILQMLVEMGAVVLIALFAVFLYLMRFAYYVYKKEKDTFLKGFALGYLGIIPALVVANMTGDRFNHVDLTAIFWMLSACVVKLRGIIKAESITMGLR